MHGSLLDMANRRTVDQLSTEELEQIVAIRKREKRLERLRKMEADGRLAGARQRDSVDRPSLGRPQVRPVGATTRYHSTRVEKERSRLAAALAKISLPRVNLRWVSNRFLILVEIVAVAGLAWILWDTWQTRQELNREVTQIHKETIEEAFPTPSPTPLIGVALLPGGHTSPLAEGGARPGEAGGIPAHLLPRVNAYKPPPIPTPGPEQPRRLVIPAIDVDHPIVPGDDWEQMKKGIGHHIGSANPGEVGNVVLTAHNDIYGEIFRKLDELKVGDEVTVYTSSRRHVYTIQSRRIVEPTEAEVMAPTRGPTITLISCYPYLIDTHRIVVTGTLKEEL